VSPVKAAIRRGLRPLVTWALPRTNALGSSLLARARSRHVLNDAYERFGPWFGTIVTRAFSNAEIRSEFVWTTRVSGQTILIPVLPTLHRSWSNALLWNWPAALPLRLIYEWYLGERPADLGRDQKAVLVDIGANDGMHTYPFAANGWACVAVEPQASCVGYIEQVCALNEFRNVETVCSVVSDVSAPEVDFYVSASSWFSSLDRTHVETFENPSQVRLPAVTLDEICATRAIRPTAIKIDVEGAEERVLAGGRTTVESVRPDLFIEVLAVPPTRRLIWSLLSPLDYRFFGVTQDWRRPLEPIGTEEELVGFAAEHRHMDLVALADSAMARRFEEKIAGS
jgi:FkbM family methyltransferase